MYLVLHLSHCTHLQDGSAIAAQDHHLFFFQAEDGIRDIGVTGVQTFVFFFSSRRRHTRYWRDWSSDVCSSDLTAAVVLMCAVIGLSVGLATSPSVTASPSATTGHAVPGSGFAGGSGGDRERVG